MSRMLSHRRPVPAPLRLFAGLATAVSALALGGCGVYQQVSVRDDNTSSLAVRAAYRPATWARSDGRPGPGFEVGFDRYSASDVRRLLPGDTLVLKGQTINGPDDVAQSATVRRVHVVYTHPIYFGDIFQLEPFLGLANVQLRYRAVPATSPARPELIARNTGAYGGITPRVRVNEWLSAEARLSLMPNIEYSNIYNHAVEVAAVLSPVPSLALRLGYAQRRTGTDYDTYPNTTQIDLRATGPFATLQFEF